MFDVTVSEFFELLFIVGFALAWPSSIYKSIKSKTAKGKSLTFLLVVLFSYLCGIISKLTADHITFIIYFYAFNTLLVLTDTILYFINSKHDKNREKTEKLYS